MGTFPVSREALHAVFGPQAFALGLFYAHQPALRFELSLGGDRLDQFEQAWDRGRGIVDTAFGDAPALVAVVSWFSRGPMLRHREVFRSLRACGVRPGRPRAAWTEPYVDPGVDPDLDGPETRAFAAFFVERQAVHRLLWGALAVDLGIRPRLEASLYLADPERGVLVHPYDDRGMDVIGPDRARLAELYGRFNDRLLDWDRERMDAFFAA